MNIRQLIFRFMYGNSSIAHYKRYLATGRPAVVIDDYPIKVVAHMRFHRISFSASQRFDSYFKICLFV